jgi:RNA polymerase sigma factor (sigma-70 family)
MKQAPQSIAADAATRLDEAAIAKLVEDYVPLVISQVERVWLSPRLGLTREDLISAGCYGLLMAARRFDPSRGIGFGVFARSHVHGALMREINLAMKATGSAADGMTLADEDIDPDSLPDQQGADVRAEIAEVRDLMEFTLTEQERLLLALYYQEQLTLGEAAAVVDSSESAVARTIKAALTKLRDALEERRTK